MNFTIAVKDDGSIYTTGYNSNGQLGLNDTTNRNTFTQVSAGWIYTDYDDKDLPRFGGGDKHSLATYGNGTLYATGQNYWGQLGIGNSGYEAVQAGGGATDNDKDEFTSTVDSIPTDGETDTWDFVVCGDAHTMSLKKVSETTTTTYNDDNEPQIWSMD